MRVTEELPEWEDSRSIGRKRKWFTITEALAQLAQHKPIQRSYIQSLYNTNPRRNNATGVTALAQYSHNQMTSLQLVNNSTANTRFD